MKKTFVLLASVTMTLLFAACESETRTSVDVKRDSTVVVDTATIITPDTSLTRDTLN